MGLLFLCSLFGLYIVIQKWLYLKSNRPDLKIVDKIKKHYKASGKEGAIQALLVRGDFASKVLASAIQLTAHSKEEVREGVSELVSKEMPQLEKNMAVLSALITITPILGLLGTVIGLMDIFNVISGGGIGDPTLLSAGIAKALITTVTGLSIAIPLIICYHYLGSEIDNRLHILESHVHSVVKFFKLNP